MVNEFTLEEIGEAWRQAREGIERFRQLEWLTPEDWAELKPRLEALFSYPNPCLDDDEGTIKVEAEVGPVPETGMTRAATIECQRKMAVLHGKRKQLQVEFTKSAEPELRERIQRNMRQMDTQVEQLRQRMQSMLAYQS